MIVKLLLDLATDINVYHNVVSLTDCCHLGGRDLVLADWPHDATGGRRYPLHPAQRACVGPTQEKSDTFPL